MKKKRATIRISTIEEYVDIFNGFFKLTAMQRNILCRFIRKKIARARSKEEFHTHLFHHSVKKEISRELNRDGHYWINSYIKELKDKGALIPQEKDGHYRIHKALVPGGENQVVINIKWENKEDNTKDG